MPQLDAVRALACSLVILSHSPPVPGQHPINFLIKGGWVGVDIFFVLSGFLVSGILFKEYISTSKINATRFLVRRALKIYPPFYFFLGVTAILIAALASDTANIKPNKLLPEVLFVQNYFSSTWGHTWSLAVEEHFYLFTILAFHFFARSTKRNTLRGIPLCVLLVCAFAFCARVFVEDTLVSIPQQTHLRMDSLSVGVLIAYYWHFHSHFLQSLSSLSRFAMGIFGLTLLSLPCFYSGLEFSWVRVYGLTFNYLGAASLLIAILPMRISSKNWLVLIPAWMGRSSYSIYIWHVVVVIWLLPRIKEPLIAWSPHAPWMAAMAFSFALGIAMAFLLELPVLRLRDRLFPSPSRPEPSALDE